MVMGELITLYGSIPVLSFTVTDGYLRRGHHENKHTKENIRQYLSG